MLPMQAHFNKQRKLIAEEARLASVMPEVICNDGGLLKKVLEEGEAGICFDTPRDIDDVSIMYKVRLDNDGTLVKESDDLGWSSESGMVIFVLHCQRLLRP